jgi:amino acid adenylation domain-containing protein
MLTASDTRSLDAQSSLPMTESQKGLLVVEGRVSARHLYNELVRFDFDPGISDDVVIRALRTVVTVQPAMRQVFAVLPEMHSRLSPPPRESELPLARVLATPREYELQIATAAHEIVRPAFDLAGGPAYRFALVRCSDGSAAAILLCDHHIVLDGTSLEPLARDLDEALSTPPTEDEIARRRAARETAFANELAAQSRAACSDGVAARAQTWAAQLREVPPLVLAPRPGRPSKTDFSGARVSWMLSEEESAALGDTCRRLEITPFTAIMGLYGAALARHGNVSRVLVGSPFMTRRTIAAFDLGGFFVNTLPVTVDADWECSVDEHLRTGVRCAVDFCKANVDVTLNQLVALARPDRSSDRNPLFSAILVMQDVPSLKRARAVRRVTELANGTAKFDLRLNATCADGRWTFEFEYDQALIAPAVADAILGSLRTATRLAIRDGSCRLADAFTDASAPSSVRSDGRSARLRASDPSAWIVDGARTSASAPAVEGPSKTLSYAELAGAVDVAAAGLAARGIAQGDVVGVGAGELCETVTALLAILRAGAAYLPLDPGLPEERLTYMVEKAGCNLVLGRDAIPGTRSVDVAELTGAGRSQGSTRSRGDAPVYVMFTSGSTGRPKGVQMGSRPLANLARWQIAALEMGAETRFLQYAPLSFDVSFQEIMPTLACGGTIVSREPADRRDLPAVLARIVDARVTHVYLPVPALRPLLSLANAGGMSLSALRYVCVAGEQLLVDESIHEFFARHPHCTLVNLYGPTETHAVTAHRLSVEDPQWPAHVPIGMPYPNVAAYVVDVTGHLAPPGVAGELYLGGVCPADGYVNDPQRTDERFVADRFSEDDGARMYRTGDLVVRDHHDVLTYLGRVDRQVKIRGHRIEPGELEVSATAVDGVAQAVTVVRGDGSDRELALFVRGESAAGVSIDAVRARLSDALPSYMQPAHVFEIEQVPTTASGKTDRDALVRLAEQLVSNARTDEPGATPEYADQLERELAGLWSEILGVAGVARDRPVLEYGAHSLNVVTALAEVGERYGASVSMAEFFSSPTVATLAELVRAAPRSGGPQT